MVETTKSGIYNGYKVIGTQTLGLRGLVLWLKLNEGSGNIAYDSSFYNNHGTIHGATWVDGKFGKALSFDGVDDYVEVPDSPELKPTEWTIVVWVKHNYPLGEDIGHFPFIVSKGRPEKKGYWLVLNRYVQEFNVGTGDGTNWEETSTEVLDNNWHMVVGQLKGNELIAYVDLNKYSETLTFTPEVSMRDLIIGAHDGKSLNFNGIIDEVRIYNRALSENEIKMLYYNRIGAVPSKTI